jgi:haloalkane dehalogenase
MVKKEELKKLYPFESHFLDLDGIKYHYLDEGKGKPVVMLHGNPTWSFYYRNMVKALRDSHRVIVPDHIGCGFSDKPDDESYNYTLKQRVDDLENWLSHLGIKKNITLVVHDWGGMIGMAYATRHPEAIKRFVILNTSGFHLPKTKTLPWQIWAIRNTPFGSLLAQGLNTFSVGAANFCSENLLPREVREAYIFPYDSWDNRVAVYNFVKDIPLDPEDPSYQIVSNVEKNLGKFSDKPMLICWGKHDFVFDDHFLKEWKRRFPEAEVHYFTKAGHYVLEDAGDEIIPLVKEWIKKTS